MVTGASNSDLVVILIDARHGVIEQTRRHSFIAALLGIKHFVVAINKIDLMNWDESVFNKIKADYQSFLPQLDSIHNESAQRSVHFIPLSALRGDNVVNSSAELAWYKGPTLLEILENAPVQEDANLTDPRFPIQLVIRPQSPEYPDYRGFAGRVASGVFKVGQGIVAQPSGLTSHIKSIDGLQGPQGEAFAGQSVTITLADEIDISRGDLLTVADESQPVNYQKVEAWICWTDHKAARLGGRYLLRQTSRTVRTILDTVESILDIATLQEAEGEKELKLNDIARVELRLASPIAADPYVSNRKTGAFILIDEGTNLTVAAGVILGAGKEDPEYEV